MPEFSKRSLGNLTTCDERLQRVLNAAILLVNFSVIWGHRGQADQEAAFASGQSQTPWPNSKHNASPSLAADCVPWPLDWGDVAAFERLSVTILRCAADLGVSLVWGGSWVHLKDRDHFELPDEWPKVATT